MMWLWHKDEDINIWNRIEDLEVSPYVYGQLIFNRHAKTIQWEKNNPFNK